MLPIDTSAGEFAFEKEPNNCRICSSPTRGVSIIKDGACVLIAGSYLDGRTST